MVGVTHCGNSRCPFVKTLPEGVIPQKAGIYIISKYLYVRMNSHPQNTHIRNVALNSAGDLCGIEGWRRTIQEAGEVFGVFERIGMSFSWISGYNASITWSFAIPVPLSQTT